jgi:DNA-directed RNA polymerase specialized sigma subunit
LNDQEFKSLHKKIAINLGESNKNAETFVAQLVSIYHNDIDCQNYLNWLKINTRILDMAQEVKSVQNSINQAPVQRQMLRVPNQEKLTQRIRLMRANLPLYRRGIVTLDQVKKKEYIFHIENLPSKKNSLEDSSNDLNSVLTSKEKLVVYLYFGFHTDDSKSIMQIAAFMGVSSTDVQQMLKDALVKMEAHINDFK